MPFIDTSCHISSRLIVKSIKNSNHSIQTTLQNNTHTMYQTQTTPSFSLKTLLLPHIIHKKTSFSRSQSAPTTILPRSFISSPFDVRTCTHTRANCWRTHAHVYVHRRRLVRLRLCSRLFLSLSLPPRLLRARCNFAFSVVRDATSVRAFRSQRSVCTHTHTQLLYFVCRC